MLTETKPLTEKEVIAGLEDLVERLNGCTHWEANQRGTEEVYETVTNALDLINRQNATIKRLQSLLIGRVFRGSRGNGKSFSLFEMLRGETE